MLVWLTEAMLEKCSSQGFLHRWFAIGLGPLALVSAMLTTCATPEVREEVASEAMDPPVIPGRVLTVGDIDPDTPAHRIRRIKPLADLLASRLGDSGIGSGRVVIGRDIEEMARMLGDGTVDLYIDSTFPSIKVRALVGSEILLAGSIRGRFEYSGLFVTSKEGVDALGDLLGQVVAFEERHSTSGYLLPCATLVAEGLTPVEVERPQAPVDPGKVGYYFSGDEENSIVLALDSRVAAAAISTSDWEELPSAHRNQMRIVARTASLPRQLVSLRPGIEEEVRSRLREALLELTSEPLEDHPEAWVWDFREISEEARESLMRVEDLARSIERSDP